MSNIKKYNYRYYRNLYEEIILLKLIIKHEDCRPFKLRCYKCPINLSGTTLCQLGWVMRGERAQLRLNEILGEVQNG